MTRGIYNTQQKDKILDIIKNFDHDFTIKDIYDKLDGSVGLTTIYRFIDKLITSGSVNKLIDSNNSTYYQYLEHCECGNHFYLRCEKCGLMIHVDCDCINELFNHISLEHNFTASSEKIIINGICESCRRSL